MELMRLIPAFEGHHTTFVTVDKAYQADVRGFDFYIVHDVTRWNKIRWLYTIVQLLKIVLMVRPHVVISTGALPGYFAVRIGKMFGCRTIWVDSLANVDELSMSGARIGKCADLWLTQWPHLAKPDGPEYAGQVI
ncbi:MAG: UDP-N-acetylglucosamine--LPS N-acetylglucosamine transferase [Planctomycetota bacterium]|nr:MAG: UDP-N-acetylglucosamine--LPS N-acetylglucosamine transferase [Planctomycetota bacterium]